MKKKTTLTRVFMALMLTLTMMISSTTAFAAEKETDSNEMTESTVSNVVEPRLNETVTKTFRASIPTTFYAVTTYQNPVMYISVTDNYKSSNKYTVEITSPNGSVTEKTIGGNGIETRLRYSSPGQYKIYAVIRTGTSINQTVTIKVRFANEL